MFFCFGDTYFLSTEYDKLGNNHQRINSCGDTYIQDVHIILRANLESCSVDYEHGKKSHSNSELIRYTN